MTEEIKTEEAPSLIKVKHRGRPVGSKNKRKANRLTMTKSKRDRKFGLDSVAAPGEKLQCSVAISKENVEYCRAFMAYKRQPFSAAIEYLITKARLAGYDWRDMPEYIPPAVLRANDALEKWELDHRGWPRKVVDKKKDFTGIYEPDESLPPTPKVIPPKPEKPAPVPKPPLEFEGFVDSEDDKLLEELSEHEPDLSEFE